MSNQSIPLVTFALTRPFVRELEKRGIDCDTLLRQVSLEPKSLQNNDVFIAAQSWYDFANLAAETAGDAHLGYFIGAHHAVEELPNLKVLQLQMATLGELLTTLVIDVRRFSTIADYKLETDGEVARLITKRTFVPAAPPVQIDGYFAGFMVRILSLCSGSLWQPEAITVTVCDPSALPADTRRDCKVIQGGLEGAAFCFPATWLVQRSDGSPRQSLLEPGLVGIDFIDSFHALLDLHLDRQGLSIARFAALTGQSHHTLKRRLQNAGTTYLSELDARRARTARFLLVSSERPLDEIGAKVGYPDPPSFVRAFKRWTAMTPNEYRKSVKREM